MCKFVYKVCRCGKYWLTVVSVAHFIQHFAMQFFTFLRTTAATESVHKKYILTFYPNLS